MFRAIARIQFRLATYWTCCGSQTRAPGARLCEAQQPWLLVWSEIILGNRYSIWTNRLLILVAAAGAGCVHDQVRRDPAVIAEATALRFLQREVPSWSRENGCFSCHNNGDAARALYAATQKGYRIAPNVLADTTAWVAQPGRWDHNKGDPGFSDKRLANIQFAAALLAAWEAGHVKNSQPLQEAARKAAADQEADGAWHIEPQNPIGSPATYGTTLATFMALKTLLRANLPEASDAIRKARDWLQRTSADNMLTTSILLLDASGSGFHLHPASSIEQNIAAIRRAQTSDGGWGPYPDSPPEAFDTAVALLALAEARTRPGVDGLIHRGRSFLAAQQNADGSWPASTRPAGGASYAQRVSTTAWALLALLSTRQ